MQDILINEQYLRKDWENTFSSLTDQAGLESAKFDFITSFRSTVAVNPQSDLYISGKAWELRIRQSLYHHIKTECITGILLSHFDVSHLPVMLLSSIVSVLVGSKRIKIEGTSEEVYLTLSMDDQFTGLHSAQDWYNRLPESIRIELNVEDFKDLLNELVYAGLAAVEQGEFVVFKKGQHRLRISVSWN